MCRNLCCKLCHNDTLPEAATIPLGLCYLIADIFSLISFQHRLWLNLIAAHPNLHFLGRFNQFILKLGMRNTD